MEKVERKYALTKIEAGDYLLPSNDAKTFWRIVRYVDGPSAGLEDWPKDVNLWAIWRGRRTLEFLSAVMDPTDWEHWEHWEDNFSTRADAIEAALRLSERRPESKPSGVSLS